MSEIDRTGRSHVGYVVETITEEKKKKVLVNTSSLPKVTHAYTTPHTDE